MMFMVGSVGYAATVSGDDVMMPNMPGLEITKDASINDAGKYLGEFRSVQYDVREAWYGAHATFEYGEIWLEKVGNSVAMGKVARVIVSKPQFVTHRGIFMGEDLQKVIDAYGQPDRIVNDKEGTKQYVYSVKENAKMKMMRIVFHINKNSQVDYIAYSRFMGGI